MNHKTPAKKVAFGMLLATLLLHLVCLSSVARSAEEPVTEINSWSELWEIAGNSTITNMKLNIDITSPNTCSVPWTVSTASRVLDLNGHTITSTGGSSGDCAMYISYDMGWDDYSFTVKNGKLAQNFTKTSSSSLINVYEAACTVSNYNLVLRDVDMEMSPNTKVGSAIYFERATNTLHSRKLEIDGGEYSIVGGGAIGFSAYLSGNGNTEYSSNDKIILKKMQIKNIASEGYAAIFGSSSNINQPLNSIIDKDSELYDGDMLVTDLTSTNYSSKNTLTIGSKRVALPNLTVSLASWTYGKTPNAPKVTGNLGAGTETFSYRAKGSEDWSLDVPTAIGEYELKLNVAQTENYLAGEAMTEFSILPTKLPNDAEGDSPKDNKEDEKPNTSNSPDTSDIPNPPDAGHVARKMEQDGLIQLFAETYLFAGIVAAAMLLRKKQNRYIRQY